MGPCFLQDKTWFSNKDAYLNRHQPTPNAKDFDLGAI